MFAGLAALLDLLATGWGVDAGPGSLLRGAIGHAVMLPTWQALKRQQGLTTEQCIRLMVGMVLSARDAAPTAEIDARRVEA
jgi:hypothetical protein